MSQKIDTCRLCKQEKELCYSHIIPEFFFRYTYDEDSRGLEISAEPFQIGKIQKGHREYLLCQDCENQLNKYETYVAKLWHKYFPEKIEGKMFTINNVDYKLYRLFHLSILWRASVATIETYRYVSLGPHEEKIRKMLVEENPGMPRQYPFISAIQYHEDKTIHAIMEPVYGKDGKFTYYMFYYGGVSWIYFVSSDSLSILQDPVFGKFPFFSQEGGASFLTENIANNKHVTQIASKAQKHESLEQLRVALSSI